MTQQIHPRRPRPATDVAAPGPVDKPKSLPTLQRNAIGLLLGKRDFTPAEVAKLDYQQLERAPRIGKKGIGNIRNWLKQHGLDLDVPAAPVVTQREQQKERKLAQAIDVLTRNGFVIMHEARTKPRGG